MGSYRNNGPSFSGMRTFRIFHRTQREPIIWSNKTKAEFRPEGRTVVSHRLLKLRATLKAKKQAKELRDARISKLMQGARAENARKKQAKQIRDARINDLMRDVRSEIARKKKRESNAALATQKAIMAEVRAKNRENRARDREWLLIRKLEKQSRLEEEREKRNIERSRRKAEDARRKAEKASRKAEKEQRERIRVQKALAKQAVRDRIKARELRLNRLLKEIRRKRRG